MPGHMRGIDPPGFARSRRWASETGGADRRPASGAGLKVCNPVLLIILIIALILRPSSFPSLRPSSPQPSSHHPPLSTRSLADTEANTQQTEKQQTKDTSGLPSLCGLRPSASEQRPVGGPPRRLIPRYGRTRLPEHLPKFAGLGECNGPPITLRHLHPWRPTLVMANRTARPIVPDGSRLTPVDWEGQEARPSGNHGGRAGHPSSRFGGSCGQVGRYFWS